MRRLLIAARDPAAAWAMAAVTRAARADGRFAVHLHAAEPGFAILRAEGLDPRPFHSRPATIPGGPEAAAVLAEATALLDGLRPDVVLTGLSRPGEGGIDESLLAAAATAGIPTGAVQDFWGDVNAFFGAAAQVYFVLDEQAARLTRTRCAGAAQVIGSPRHAAACDLDAEALRHATRRRLGVADGTALIGFYSQPLWEHPGYERTVSAFAMAAAAVPDAALLVRPHPRDPERTADRLRTAFEAAGPRVILDDGPVADAGLTACDAVCSAFSSCALDALYLGRNADMLPPGAVYLLFDPDLRAACERSCGLRAMPLATLGLALAPERVDDLPEALRTALSPPWRRRVRTSARRHLPDTDGLSALLDRLATMT